MKSEWFIALLFQQAAELNIPMDMLVFPFPPERC